MREYTMENNIWDEEQLGAVVGSIGHCWSVSHRQVYNGRNEDILPKSGCSIWWLQESIW